MPRGVPHTVEKVRAALIAANGNITEAAKRMKVDRCSLSTFIHETPELLQIVKDMRESIADLAEDALQKGIKRGDTALIIFTLKTQGRKRDYCENYRLLEAEEKLERLENAIGRLASKAGEEPRGDDGGNPKKTPKRPR